jgi:hypothetical protein
VNPQKAADNVFSETDFAEIRFPVAAVGTYKLKLRLNGTGRAGNRAGIVLRTNEALLSNTLLQNVRINTYGGTNGSRLIESASATTLLDLGLVADNRRQLGFLTTQDFEWVEVEITGGVGLFSAAQIYYAFADDPNPDFPAEVAPPATPLPVELRAFRGRAGLGGVELSWETASELQNKHFVVERALGDETAFQPIGQVAGAGTSTRSHAYRFLDAAAGRQARPALYYRLRQVDEDGREQLSPVVVVNWESPASAAMQLYPNPATGTQRVQVQLETMPTRGAMLAVYGSLGRQLWRVPATDQTVLLDAARLGRGLYHVVLLDAAGRRMGSQRLVIVGE